GRQQLADVRFVVDDQQVGLRRPLGSVRGSHTSSLRAEAWSFLGGRWKFTRWRLCGSHVRTPLAHSNPCTWWFEYAKGVRMRLVVGRLAIRSAALLVGGWALLYGVDAGYVELVGAVEGVDAVLLLEGVGELGVAVAEHVWIVEQDGGQSGEPLVELLFRPDALAITPGGVAVLVVGVGGGQGGVPPDAAVLADEVGLAGIGEGAGSVRALVDVRLAVGEVSYLLGEG